MGLTSEVWAHGLRLGQILTLRQSKIAECPQMTPGDNSSFTKNPLDKY